jgi:CRISPR-associated protein Cmr4
MSISDARLLAFPMRSNIAPFVWVTCPAVLKRLDADLAYADVGQHMDVPEVRGDESFSIGGAPVAAGQVVIEDAVVDVANHQGNACIKTLFPELERLILVSDEMYKYAVTCCTEIQTHIKIDAEKGTADDGALWYQEYLPADSLLYTVVHYSHRDAGESEHAEIQRALADLKAQTIKQHVEEALQGFIQIGGDETLGKGIFNLTWITGGAE